MSAPTSPDREGIRTLRRARRVLAAALGEPDHLDPELVAAPGLVLDARERDA